MLNTSGDILNLILALSVAVLTAFIVVALYYFIASIKKVHNVASGLERGVEKTEEVIDIVKSKINSSTSHLVIVAEFVKQAMQFFTDKKKKKNNKDAKDEKKVKKVKK